jgi:DNA-binding beta-propeller fold protein YncE
MHMQLRWTFALALTVLSGTVVSAEPKVTTVVGGLNNPCGVAIQPETGHVFVADSGASRVIRVVDGKAQDVITGFKTDVYGKGPMYNIGPLGLLFLDKDTLVVGGGDLLDGAEKLRVFQVPSAGAAAIQADAAVASFELKEEGEIKGEGNFYALAATADAVFVTSNGDDTKGWVAKATRKGNTLTAFERFIATKEAVEVDAPVGATISPKGELVIGQMGEINVPHDSLLTFYSPKDGKKLLNLPSGLYDISGLAYGPKGRLYAIDFAWMKADEGGLFDLVGVIKDRQQAIESKKVLSLDKPTAMAFGADGALYVTVFGTAKDENDKQPGQLLKIEITN